MAERFVDLISFFDRKSCGFYYTLDHQGRGFDYIHSEITGYALSLLCRGNGNARELDGRSTSDIAGFLLRAQHSDGGFLHSLANGPDFPDRRNEIHTFDTGICANALLDHYESSGERSSRQAAEKALDWLESALLPDSAGLHAAWNTRHKKWLDEVRRGWWSSSGGCYHGKLITPFLRAGRLRIADSLVHWLLASQREDGSWSAALTQPAIHTHAMCYALEGLAFYADTQKNRLVERSVERGIQWLARVAESFEGIPAWMPPRAPRFRADSQVQFLCLVSNGQNGARFREAERGCRARLEQLQSNAAEGTPRFPVWRLDDSPPVASSRLASWPSFFAALSLGNAPLQAVPGMHLNLSMKRASANPNTAISKCGPSQERTKLQETGAVGDRP